LRRNGIEEQPRRALCSRPGETSKLV
jgi:hypothetical protein